MNDLKIEHLSIPYSAVDFKMGHELIVADISLQIEQGTVLGIVGPTGCGKTILLKSIAGLITPSAGEIIKNGKNIVGLKPYQRGMAMVFQDYVLYPHLTAKKNVLFRIFSKHKEEEINPDVRLDEVASMLHINEEQLLSRLPNKISGGEKQRVALGKAIAVLPEVLLLDEPMSNIPENMRHELRHNIRKLIKNNNITAIYVSHNQIEIAEVSDKIAVMYQGRIEQVDTYENLYHNPKRYFVSLFIGDKSSNYIKREDVNKLTDGKINYKLTIRPNECIIGKADNSITISGEVAIIEKHISEKIKIAFIEWDGSLFGVQLPIDYEIENRAKIDISVPLDKAKYFDNDNDRIYNIV